jgi:hypothetical protein
MKDMIMSWRPGNDSGDPVARVDQVHDRVHAVQQAATISVERVGCYYFSVGNRQLRTPVPDSYHFPSQFWATAN